MTRRLPLLLALAVALAGCTTAPGPVDARTRFALDGDPYLGDPDAAVVAVAFESPLCSGCRHFHGNVLPSLEDRFFTPAGPSALYFKQFDTYGRTGAAGVERDLQVAMECTARTSHAGFWALATVLFARQHEVGPDDVHDIVSSVAAEVGFDADPVLACYGSRTAEEDVTADIALARSLDVRGTPAFFVIGPDGTATRTDTLEATLAERLEATA